MVSYPEWPKKVAKVVGRINDVFTLKNKSLSVGQSNDRWDNNASFVINLIRGEDWDYRALLSAALPRVL
jgi:hypothetical protein